MSDRQWFAVFICLIGLISIGVPIVFTFAKLFGKIGPDDPEAVFMLGFCMWIAGITGLGLCISYVIKLLNLPTP